VGAKIETSETLELPVTSIISSQ